MPWSKLALPPLFGELYALDPEQLVVWGEHGLFRYELDTHPALRLLHTPEMVAKRFNPATGTVTWTGVTFRLVGDPARVPNPAAAGLVNTEGVRLELDPAARRVLVRGDRPDSSFAVADFPPAGAAWHVAAVLARERRFILASSGGFAAYAYAPPPPPKPEFGDIWQARGGAADHAALLARVIADADDDLPRLVYADYLEERGDEVDAARAEFIRLSCRLAERQRNGRVEAGNSGVAGVGADPELARALELAARHQAAWRARQPAVVGVSWNYVAYGALAAWRGFPQVSVTSVATWRKMRARLAALSPLDCVEVDQLDAAEVAAFAQSEHFGRVRVFGSRFYASGAYVSSDERAARLRALLASPEVRRWRGLAVHDADPAVVAELAGAATLESLEWLRFGPATDPEHFRPLVDSPHLPRLRSVEFRAWGEQDQAALVRLDAALAARRRG